MSATMIDLSQPVSDVLRAGTTAANERMGRSQGAHWLFRGELDLSEYIRFQIMLYYVYE